MADLSSLVCSSNSYLGCVCVCANKAVLGSREGKLRVWDLTNPRDTPAAIQDNTPMTTLETPHQGDVRVVGFNPNYLMLVTASEELVSFLFERNDSMFPGFLIVLEKPVYKSRRFQATSILKLFLTILLFPL